MLRPRSDLVTHAHAAIRLDGVARRFGQRWVLRGIDLTIEPGEVVALTGRNGSGKTTLLRIIATLLRPTRGSATVLGYDTVRAGEEIRGQVGLLGHDSGLYDDLTAVENLVFAARMAGGRADDEAIGRVLARVGLGAVQRDSVRGFSAGMRRRLALARLMLRPPRVLLLDEPHASFDDEGIGLVNGFMVDVARAGGVVLLTTHDMTRVADVVTRRVHITDGLLAGRAHEGGPGRPREADVAPAGAVS
jgi:heme exporter protein A